MGLRFLYHMSDFRLQPCPGTIAITTLLEFCSWLVSDYTKEVLKVRMNQSKHLLYLSSHRSRNSEWVSFELDYYENCLHREILMIVLDGDDGHDFRRIDLEATGKSLLGDLSN